MKDERALKDIAYFHLDVENKQAQHFASSLKQSTQTNFNVDAEVNICNTLQALLSEVHKGGFSKGGV